MRRIKASYGGTCKGCGGSFQAGSVILYGGRGLTFHVGCQDTGQPALDAEYRQGMADAHRWQENKRLFGPELADQWEMERELREGD